MKALILAAGTGSRLKPLTDVTPKALLPICGKPLLYYAIEKLAAVGVTEIVVNVHHLANQVIAYIQNMRFFGVQLFISDERDDLLDTGGGLKKAAAFFNDNHPFFVYNVDVLTSLNLSEMFQFHLQHEALVTIAVSHRDTSRYLLFDDNMYLHGWADVKKNIHIPEDIQSCRFRKKAFSGIHVIHPKLFELIDKEGSFPILPEYIRLCAQYPIIGFDHTGAQWLDVGKPESFALAESIINIL
jgi:NDP-sugar pyrophosphorylase family protein